VGVLVFLYAKWTGALGLKFKQKDGQSRTLDNSLEDYRPVGGEDDGQSTKLGGLMLGKLMYERRQLLRASCRAVLVTVMYVCVLVCACMCLCVFV